MTNDQASSCSGHTTGEANSQVMSPRTTSAQSAYRLGDGIDSPTLSASTTMVIAREVLPALLASGR